VNWNALDDGSKRLDLPFLKGNAASGPNVVYPRALHEGQKNKQ
jgi:hypothetical protein